MIWASVNVNLVSTFIHADCVDWQVPAFQIHLISLKLPKVNMSKLKQFIKFILMCFEFVFLFNIPLQSIAKYMYGHVSECACQWMYIYQNFPMTENAYGWKFVIYKQRHDSSCWLGNKTSK